MFLYSIDHGIVYTDWNRLGRLHNRLYRLRPDGPVETGWAGWTGWTGTAMYYYSYMFMYILYALVTSMCVAGQTVTPTRQPLVEL